MRLLASSRFIETQLPELVPSLQTEAFHALSRPHPTHHHHALGCVQHRWEVVDDRPELVLDIAHKQHRGAAGKPANAPDGACMWLLHDCIGESGGVHKGITLRPFETDMWARRRQGRAYGCARQCQNVLQKSLIAGYYNSLES